MTNYQILDRPVTTPEWDLLGMAVYAERLADYISDVEPQFTLGVYGQWGEGKTSFVNLLKGKLRERQGTEMVFIEFSAWPYATADDLWRALILTIVQELCGPPPRKEKEPAELRHWLQREVLVLARRQRHGPEPALREEEQEAALKKDACARLAQWADQAAYTGISKGGSEQLQLNQEVALLAIVRAGVEALSIMSPLVRAVRNFLGIESSVDVTALFQQEKSEVKQESIDSVQQLQREGADLFKQIKGDKRVYVFVDDLDRCLPDVALDLLEAIKNFLNVGLIFIVAADEALIGQGLRLRYKELVSRISADEMNDFITQKGREYFEKIIQFGIRVPPRTPEEAHRYIAAQFPQWQSATDIIQTALGTNPRRLKQYCNLLTYKRLVGSIPLSMTGPDEEAPVAIVIDEPAGPEPDIDIDDAPDNSDEASARLD